MSIKLMVEIREHSPSQNGERLVLLALADYANDEAKAWPSIPSLAKWANLSERSVQNALRGLEARGEITTEIAAGPHGCNLFYITPGGTRDASDEFPLPAPPTKSARKRQQKAAIAEEKNAEEESPADIVESEQGGSEQGGADIAPVQIVHPADIAPVGDENDNDGGADIAPGGVQIST